MKSVTLTRIVGITLVAAFGSVMVATAQRPSSQEAIILFNQGNTYKQQGKLAEAIAAYKKALSIDPNFADAHYNLGRTYYLQAAQANNVDPEARFATKGSPTQRYTPKWEKGLPELKLALQEFKEAAKLQPRAADIYSMLGLVFHNMGEHDKAIEFNNRAIELDPRGLDGQDSRHDNALIYFYVKKRRDLAVQLLEENLKINPSHSASQQLLKIIGK